MTPRRSSRIAPTRRHTESLQDLAKQWHVICAPGHQKQLIRAIKMELDKASPGKHELWKQGFIEGYVAAYTSCRGALEKHLGESIALTPHVTMSDG